MPALPQLGGKLMYEQYYGKQVALFGVDNRQANPHAITAGITYTPVPLITLGASQREGQDGQHDTRFTLDVNYQLGVPWRSQLDPSAVAGMRSLAGSRYELVDRNNNIVLEYRKKTLIRLHTVSLVTGQGGEEKSLGVSVNSQYGLAGIDWSAVGLLAAGGKIVHDGGGYAVILPAYQSGSQAANTYAVSGVAVDVRGNHSARSDTQVTVQVPQVNTLTSTFTPVSSTLPADGRSTQVLTLRNRNNQPVDVGMKDISLKSSGVKNARVSALTRKSAGVYNVTVTAGTDSETVTLTPTAQGVRLSPAVVTITTPAQAASTIATDKTSYTSGKDMRVTVTLKNTQGNPVNGQAATPAKGVTVPNATQKGSWIDNHNGTYTVTWTATTAATNLRATLKLSRWGGSVDSAVYAIKLGEQAPASINTQVNPYTFKQSSEEGTFPITGFTGATFTIVPKCNKKASDYTWSSDASWISVSDGVVKFNGTGTGGKVTIIGTPSSEQGKIIKYSFTLKGWFINVGSNLVHWSRANTYCSQSGYSLPTIVQMTNNTWRDYGQKVNDQSRATNAGLWSEWGDLSHYSGAGFTGCFYWVSEQYGVGSAHYAVETNGHVNSDHDFARLFISCRKGL